MAGVHIRTRLTKSGLRFDVRYRLGGRATPVIHAGTFTSLKEAQEFRAKVSLKIAGAKLTRAAPPGSKERVYVAKLGPLVKIGVSVNPERRCATLNAEPLLILEGGRPVERELHERFADHRESGEWFWAAPELLAWVENVKAGKSQYSAARVAA